VSKIRPKRGASASQAATHICTSGVTFARLLNEGVIKRQPRDVGYDLDEVRKARLQQLERAAAGRGGESVDTLVEERIKLTRARRKREEMQAEIEAGQRVPIEPIQHALEGMLIGMRNRLLALPGTMAHLVEMRTRDDAFHVLDEAVREALEEIADPAFAAASAARAGLHEIAAGIRKIAGLDGKADQPNNDGDDDDCKP